jgi:hypothetical protein
MSVVHLISALLLQKNYLDLELFGCIGSGGNR